VFCRCCTKLNSTEAPHAAGPPPAPPERPPSTVLASLASFSIGNIREEPREQFSRRCARSRQVKGVLRTLKHGQNRTSCVFDKRYAEQQCRRDSRQRRKFAPPGASQKKGAISEFPTKGYPPNLRVVANAPVGTWLMVSSAVGLLFRAPPPPCC
jgi:hypothetical protein